MGLVNSKDFLKKKIDEATSNSSLSNLRYVITEKPKWKVFKKREAVAIPAYTALKPLKGCPCGNSGACKQKVTPKGVTIHYPQKKRKFSAFGTKSRRNIPGKTEGLYGGGQRVAPKVKIVRPRKFPTWRLDRITYNTYRTPVITPRIYS